MSQSDGVQHLCKRVPATLCSFPNYCARSGCVNLPPRKEDKEKPRG